MQNRASLVTSLGALLLGALIALSGCGAPNPSPGADRGDVGPAPDAVTTDRADPEDHPVVILDAGDSNVTDASVPTDVLPDVATDSSEASDVPPLPLCGQTVAVTGERCSRPFPPGMMPARTAVGIYVCAPRRVTVGSLVRTTVYTSLGCGAGVDGLDYLTVEEVLPGPDSGSMPCVGTVCFYYRGPGFETPGIEWDMTTHIGRGVIWPAGVIPGMGPSTQMPEHPYARYD